MDKSRENPRHPLNDPLFLGRQPADPLNPANNAEFIFDLVERMEEDDGLREAIWECFLEGDLSFLLHDRQLEILEMVQRNDIKEFLIFCARQFGKSFVILVVSIIHCARPFGRRKPLVRIFCETIKQVEDIVNDNMQLIMRLAPPGYIKRTKSENRWKVGVGEIRLCPMAAAHVDGKRGGNATLIILEEGCVTKSDAYKRAIGSVINPQLLRSRGKLGHVTTPSRDVAHYVHAQVLPKCRVNGAYANYTLYDNPQLSVEQICEAFDRATDEEEWDREYLCRVVKSQTLTVIPEFDGALFVRKATLPRFAHWQTALDFGGVRDKHGVLLTYWDFERAKLCVFRERFPGKNTATQQIKTAAMSMEKEAASLLEEQGSVLWLTGHPRRVSDCPGQILIDLRSLGFNVRTPDKEQGSWEAGINAVRVAFQNDQIEIDPSCVWLIATLDFGLYTSNRKDWERTDELGHLDLLAALIYAWRHRNTANPIPANFGLHRERQYVPPTESQKDLSTALLPAFLRT